MSDPRQNPGGDRPPNLFATVLTHCQPSSNYGGEGGGDNRKVLQKITLGRHDYAIVSPEAIRNALREQLGKADLPVNRTRLHEEGQPAVEFKGYPHPAAYADDFFFGYLIAAGASDRRDIARQIIASDDDPRGEALRNDLKSADDALAAAKAAEKKSDSKAKTSPEKKATKKAANAVDAILDRFSELKFKRDSLLRTNMAVALEPVRHDSVFRQSPKDATPDDRKAHKNDDSSNLLHRDVTVTAMQYPFALNLGDCLADRPDHPDREKAVRWTRTLLEQIGELANVAGGHALSLFHFEPASVVVRLTRRLAPGFDSYGFAEVTPAPGLPPRHVFPTVVDELLHPEGAFAGEEGGFHLGGQIVRDLPEADADALRAKGVTLDRSAARLLRTAAAAALGGEATANGGGA